jgi:uncharacterized protein (TIGR02118 family)
MICVSVLYPLSSHGIVRYEIQQGLSGLGPGSEPVFACTGNLYFNAISDFQQGMAAHGAELQADIPNFTDIQPQFQISEVV